MDEDKLIEELDVDFISGILAPSDLQMADNMIDDLMSDFDHHNSNMHLNKHHMELREPTMHTYINSNTMLNSDCTNFNKNITDNQLISEHIYNSSNTSNIQYLNNNNNNNINMVVSPLEQQQFNYSNNTSNNNTTNNMNMNHVQIQYNQQQVLLSSPLLVNNEQNSNKINYPVQTNISFMPVNNNNNNNNQINFNGEPIQSVKKVRKNLKDMLKDELTVTSYTNIIQNNPVFNTNQPIFNNKFQNENLSIETNKTKRRSINSIINGENTANTTTTNNNNSQINYSQPMLSTPILPVQLLNSNENMKSTIHGSPSPNIILLQNNDSTKVPMIQFQTSNNGDLQQSLRNGSLSNPSTEHRSSKPNKSKKKNNDKENHELDLENDDYGSGVKKPKFQKKTAHNAIEKKYRSSINDKITELKVRVAGPDVKLQKSGILRRALEYITNIENMNRSLSDENKILKSALKTISLNTNNPTVILDTLNTMNYSMDKLISDLSTNSMPNTPPSLSPSDGDSFYSTGDSSNESQPSSPSSSSMSLPPKKSPNRKQKNKKLISNNKMQDASRVMLCMFVMSVVFFNPFNLIISNDNSNQNDLNLIKSEYKNEKSFNVRVLNSIDSVMDTIDSVNSSQVNLDPNKSSYIYLNMNFMISWLLNISLIVFCLIRLYISGEPRMNDNNSKTLDESVMNFYKKASKSFQAKDFEEAMFNCEQGLIELGQSQPKTKFQLITGIVWQLIRLTLDKLYIGVYLSKIALWYNNVNNMKLYKLSALFYYEMHKFSYLNMKSEDDFVPKTTSSDSSSKESKANGSNQSSVNHSTQTTYSKLRAIYYMLACYNMTEIYTRFEKNNLRMKDEFSLIEYYLSAFIYIIFFLPKSISRIIITYMIKQKLIKKLSYDSSKDEADFDEEEEHNKLNQLKKLLKKNIFIEFLINFENYSTNLMVNNFQTDEINTFNQRQRLMNLILYKRKLFSTPYLYDLWEDYEVEDEDEASCEGLDQLCVASKFILAKFQDHVLFKMTNHIINQSSMISVDEIINANNNVNVNSAKYLTQDRNPIDLDEELIEIADVDQVKFERLKCLYKQNADCLLSKNESEHDTQLLLTEFLNMLNNWKLRKFNEKSIDVKELKNIQKSYFIESLIQILKAHDSIHDKPLETIENCKKSIEYLNKFKNTTNYYTSNNYLVEKFEILIYDWILSAQTYLWTKNKLVKLDLFNEALSRYQNIIVNYPQLNSKAKMYETIIFYASNRNPIGLQKQTARQTLFSKCNQEAFLSMNSILKNFHLQIIE